MLIKNLAEKPILTTGCALQQTFLEWSFHADMYAYRHASTQEATLELDTIIHPGFLNHLLDPARSTLFIRVLPALYDLPSNKGHSVLTNLAVEIK